MRAIPILLACAVGVGCAVGNIGGDPPGDPDNEPGAQAVEKVVPRIGLRRLTAYEYDNTLRDLLGEPSRKSAFALPEDPRTPFDNDVLKQEPSKALVEGVELLARDAAKSVLADTARRDKVVGCVPKGASDDACFTSFIRTFGRRALRRTLEEEEVTKLAAFSSFSVEANDFYAGVETVLLALLQHEELVYRVEIGTPVEGRPNVVRLTDRELATRLSYFVWASTPDDALLDAAEGGGLADEDGIRAEAKRLLSDDRAKQTVNRFHALWLGYDKVLDSGTLAKDMTQETEALVQRTIFGEKRPWQSIFESTDTYVTDALATHYGLPSTGSATPQWVPYGTSGRKGILSQGLFLINGAKLDDTSPTLRGKAVRLRLMCQTIPPPPPGVNTDLPPLAAGQCKTDRMAAHSKGGCASCHGKMDPIGFGLEAYDQQGRFRTTEPGKPECAIKGDGELEGVGKFNGPSQLADLMLQDGAVQTCMAMQMYRFAIGRGTLDDDDERFVPFLLGKVGGAKGGFKFDDLLVEFVATEAFRHRRQLGGE
ncbi:MAG: DUF1592 domain-containing protein [Polyangiales bacterium]